MTFESFAPCFNWPDETRPFQTAVIALPLSCSAANGERSSGEVRSKSLARDRVFEGALYGPPLPDPKLPDAIRKVYHPGWGHLGAFQTKLDVHTIRTSRSLRHQTHNHKVLKAPPRPGNFSHKGMVRAGGGHYDNPIHHWDLSEVDWSNPQRPLCRVELYARCPGS